MEIFSAFLFQITQQKIINQICFHYTKKVFQYEIPFRIKKTRKLIFDLMLTEHFQNPTQFVIWNLL